MLTSGLAEDISSQNIVINNLGKYNILIEVIRFDSAVPDKQQPNPKPAAIKMHEMKILNAYISIFSGFTMVIGINAYVIPDIKQKIVISIRDHVAIAPIKLKYIARLFVGRE